MANRSASVARVPEAPGTMAGPLDLSFNSSADLEIFKLDFQNDDHELPVAGDCLRSERFNRLPWGCLGLEAKTSDKWHPDVATKHVASDEDGSPALRLWDMRNIISLVKEFVGHTKGIIAMAWCPSDSS
ncbi:hypothetical protein CCACVL1_20447 [Corchorus capsularis]|uniref:Uncharacterized protein n=1 Tax=Corchorus capsularis TaxID=210143 RepID=A0A1R3HBB7_COCAP|nr:hypothetical protein CCACVL1_20447 [Corchorus capsularis]